MVRYRRNFVPGGTYFFTVTLADRASSALLDHVSALRMAFRITRHERPFTIEAIVILPEHLHAIWTLPSGDSDFPGRGKRIKAYFTHRVVAAGVPVERAAMANTHSGNGVFGSTRFGTRLISSDTSTTWTSTRSSTSWRAGRAIGPIRRFTSMSGAVCCRPIGAAISTNPRWISASGGVDPGLR
jgi:REP element-mobilizing transposase RayT